MALDTIGVTSSPITTPPQPAITQTVPQIEVRPSVVDGQTIPRSPLEVRSVGTQQLTEPPSLNALKADDDITVAQDIMADLIDGPEADTPKPGLLKQFFQAAGRILKSIFSGQNAAPQFHELPANIKLQHPSGRGITLSSKALPPIPVGISVEDFMAGIQEKINRGGDLVNTVLSGDMGEHQCTKRDTADIMWFLQTTAESKVGEAWNQGAISMKIPEP